MTKDKFRILWLKRQHVETKRKNWIWFEKEKKKKKESTGVGHAGLPRNVRGFTMNNKKKKKTVWTLESTQATCPLTPAKFKRKIKKKKKNIHILFALL